MQSKISNVNGIVFTSREMDVIACITNGRSIKSIAALLEISPNTVNAHIRNITNKINCSSQDSVIKFIETSQQYNAIHRHYVGIILSENFRKNLIEIAWLAQTFQTCCIHYFDDSELIENFEIYLRLAGIKALRTKEHSNKIEIQEEASLTHIIFSNDVSVLATKSSNVIFIAESFPSKSHCKCIPYGKPSNFYFATLECIATIIKNESISKPIDNFKKFYYGKAIEIEESASTEAIVEAVPAFYKKYAAAICFVTVLILFFIFGDGLSSVGKSQIRSSLPLISDNTFIERDDIIKRIEDAFESGYIKVAAIIGLGGAGKTIIARKYIQSRDDDIIWEINAETEESIRMAFSRLATFLARTKAQKEELDTINSTIETEERNSRIIFFVSNAFKSANSWCLLFDNVDDFNNIKNYFPYDHKIWGKGRVIITSRNANIRNIGFLGPKNIVDIGFLSSGNKSDLFRNILFGKGAKLSEEKLKAIDNFLESIPPIPLDVSAAAYYIKSTNASYDDYLRMMRDSHEDFNNIQSKLLSENLGYGKTRYNIVKSTLESIFDINPKYKKLVLCLCLLDSQSIPKSSLKKLYKKDSAIDDFFHVLRKYSLITDNGNKFSIHRLIQELGIQYLMKILGEEEKIDYLNEIVETLTPYSEIAWYLYESTRPQMPSDQYPRIARHLSSLKNKIQKLPLDKNKLEEYNLRISLALLFSYKYSKSAFFLKDFAKKIIDSNRKRRVFNNLDFAVLLEIYANKCIHLGNYKEAEDSILECLSICSRTPNSSNIKAICLADYGRLMTTTGNFEKGKNYLDQALEIVSPSDVFWKKQAKVTIFNRYSVCMNNQYVASKELFGPIKIAKEILNELGAKEFFYKKGSYTGEQAISIFLIQRKLSGLYNRVGKFNKALECEKEALFLFGKIKDEGVPLIKHESTLAIDYGCTLLRMNRLEEAYKAFTYCIEKKQEIEDSGGLIYAFVYRSEILMRKNRLNEAYKDCLRAIEAKGHYVDNSARFSEAFAYSNMALINYKQHNYPLAFENFTKFFSIMKEVCRFVLSKKTYDALANEGVFAPPEVITEIKQYWERAQKIFTAVYGPSHPFIKDFIERYN